jgi:acetylglutamate kinase
VNGVEMVVKLGGSLLEDDRALATVAATLAGRCRAGARRILVHGGGKRIDAALAARGIPRRIHEGLRITDRETLAIVVSALGDINSGLVRELARHGVTAAGLCGPDGRALRADFHPPIRGVDLGFVGRISSVDLRMIEAAVAAGHLPVLASIAAGPDGVPLNVNADEAAAAVAAALGCRRLLFLTDVEGIADERGRVVARLDPSTARRLLSGSAVSGGMRPKLRACLAAVGAGVREVVIAGPGRQEAALAGGAGGTSLVAA